PRDAVHQVNGEDGGDKPGGSSQPQRAAGFIPAVFLSQHNLFLRRHEKLPLFFVPVRPYNQVSADRISYENGFTNS
ncbi:MAG TPA: hypothetical protein VEL76_35470, partial [Gemmataceae bacterium]|nr:hypothetical protein [Gemmataceae bacterium]